MERPRTAGFTLIELVTSLAVLGVLGALAAPALAQALDNARVTHAMHTMTSSLALARSLAVTTGHAATLCPSTDGLTCHVGTDWTTGWLVYRDPDSEAQPPTQAHVAESSTSIGGNLSLRTTSARPRVRYLAPGWAYGSNASLHLCDKGDPARLLASIVVNNAGRTRVLRPRDPAPCPASALPAP